MQFGARLAVFLYGDRSPSDGTIAIERRDEFFPGVRFGGAVVDVDVPLFENGGRFRTADDRDAAIKRLHDLILLMPQEENIQQRLRADAGEKDHDFDLTGEQFFTEVEYRFVLFKRNLSHRRSNGGDATEPFDELPHFLAAAAFE